MAITDDDLDFLKSLDLSQPTPGNSGLSDTLNDIGIGALRIPSAVTGLADIPLSLVGFDRPISRATDAIGEATGFQPSKMADEAQRLYSAPRQIARENVNNAWQQYDQGQIGLGEAVRQTIAEPRVLAGNVVESLPSMAAGGFAGRAALGAGIGAAALGEGAVSAGQQMSQINKNVDPQKAALASLATGAAVGATGTIGGKIASKLGINDVDVLAAGGLGAQAGQSAGKAIAKGALSEGAEEGVQSASEQGLQNYAEGNPITQGMARSVTEGALAGGAMGGVSNIANSGPLGKAVSQAQPAQPEPQQQDQPQDKQPLALPELIFTADGSSLNKADVLRGFIQNGATEEQANDYLKQITSLPQEQRTEVNLDPYRFLQERDAQTMREYGDDPEAVNERIAIKGENNIADPGYDENAPFEIDLKNPKAWEDSVSWDEADLFNEPKQTEQPNQEIRKRLLQSQPVSTQTEPVPPAQSQLSPEVANADNPSGAVVEDNSRATSGNQGATEPSRDTGTVASTGFGGKPSGGTANVQPKLQGQEPANANVDRRALDPILTTPKSAYVISELKAQKIKKDSPGFKQARSAIEADYEQKLDQALANAPFEVYASHPSNANVPSQDLLRQGYNKLQQDLKNAENQTQPVLPNTSTDTSGNVASANSNPQQSAVPAQEITASNGQPFKNIGGAQLTQKRQGLTESHDVVSVDGGYVLRPKQVFKSDLIKNNKSYHVVAINEKTGKKTYLSIEPMPHVNANTFRSKFNPVKNVRIQLEEVYQTENKQSQADKENTRPTEIKALSKNSELQLNKNTEQNDQSQNTATQTPKAQKEISATAEKPSTVSNNKENLQKEVNQELTALFKKLGKKQIAADSKLLEGVENADKIAVIQNNWLDILEDHAYEADKDNGIKGNKSQTIIMNGC